MAHRFISGGGNAFITDIRKLKQKKHRDRTGLFYVEGKKLLNEALNSGFRIRYIICTGPGAPHSGAEVITVTDEVYKKITDEEAPEGVMCVVEKPAGDTALPYNRPVIILDSVRDPGNVGTIIRTADALCGVDIILSGGCADIYSGKTQRAAMGAVFRQNIKISKNLAEDIANLKKKGYNILAAHLDKNSRPINDIKFDAKTAAVFGNEGGGLSGETAGACDGRMIIPINPHSESLNVAVAAGIVLWEIKRQGVL